MGGATYRTHLNAQHAIYLIRSKEGLTLEKSASETPYGGQYTLSSVVSLIKFNRERIKIENQSRNIYKGINYSWPRCFPVCNILYSPESANFMKSRLNSWDSTGIGVEMN